MARQRKKPAGTASEKPAAAKPARRTAKKAAPRAAAKTAQSGERAAPRGAAKAAPRDSQRSTTRRASLEPVTTLRHDEIAERAYFIWMKNGRAPGQEVQHWVEAENQLRQERGAQPLSRR